MFLKIISLFRMAVLYPNAGPRIVGHVIFSLPKIAFSRNLTKRVFSTYSLEDLSCKSYNAVYAIECALCGLI